MKLSDSKIKKLKDGTHADGGGLYFQVTKSGARRFLFRWTGSDGKRATKALGIYPALTLADAREEAAQLRKEIAAGSDPRRAVEEVKRATFGAFVRDYIETHEKSWKNPSHIRRWKMQMLGPSEVPPRGREKAPDYCATLRSLTLDQIDTAAILRVLKPVWLEKRATAERLRINLEIVLDAATAAGLRSGENPARWRGHLKHLLPSQKSAAGVRHQPALPFRDLPAFIAQLQQGRGVIFQALEMCILTCLRSKELRGARLEEFDLERRIWTVPAERMKRAEDHEIPLTDRMIAIVQERQEQGATDYLFAGPRSGQPIADASLSKPLKGFDATVHGMRSTFRDWAGEMTEFDSTLAEMALHHAVGSQTERAYRRGNALERRRKLMEAWEDFCLSEGRCRREAA